jgi:ubiquinone/menaquinone biosynthesis C-methylase UbiE
VACRLTGENGRGYGIDLTGEMVRRAKKNLAAAGTSNFKIEKVDSEKLPFPDNFFDLVISNGVINLSPCKQVLFGEIFRVLKPGGKIQFADVMLEGELPPHLTGSLEAWSQ